MIIFTVADLFNFTTPEEPRDYSLYLVRDSDVCFYVGKSQRSVVNRLYEHLGYAGSAWQPYPSTMGKAVYLNRSLSDNWEVIMMTPGDIGLEPIVSNGISREFWEAHLSEWGEYPESWGRPFFHYPEYTVDFAEEKLIKKYKPCFNVIYNSNPSSMPEYYHEPYHTSYIMKRDIDTGFWQFEIKPPETPKNYFGDAAIERFLQTLDDCWGND